MRSLAQILADTDRIVKDTEKQIAISKKALKDMSCKSVKVIQTK